MTLPLRHLAMALFVANTRCFPLMARMGLLGSDDGGKMGKGDGRNRTLDYIYGSRSL